MSDSTPTLSNAQINERAGRCIASDDIAGMVSLHDDMKNANCDEYETVDELVEKILVADKVAMCVSTFGLDALVDWGNDNTDMMVEKCPKVLDQWVASSEDASNCLGASLEKSLDEDQQCTLLLGQSALPAHNHLYHLLQSNPDNWKTLTPQWIGAAHSNTRQAAVVLGWRPSMLVAMVDSHRMEVDPLPRWFAYLAYPLSLCVAADVAHRMDIVNGRTSARPRGPRRKFSVARVECNANADPQDVALAQMLLQKMPGRFTLEAHSDTPAVPQAQRAHLQSLVDMHVNLDCMNVLVDFLCRDALPGALATVDMDAGLCLPELGA